MSVADKSSGSKGASQSEDSKESTDSLEFKFDDMTRRHAPLESLGSNELTGESRMGYTVATTPFKEWLKQKRAGFQHAELADADNGDVLAVKDMNDQQKRAWITPIRVVTETVGDRGRKHCVLWQSKALPKVLKLNEDERRMRHELRRNREWISRVVTDYTDCLKDLNVRPDLLKPLLKDISKAIKARCGSLGKQEKQFLKVEINDCKFDLLDVSILTQAANPFINGLTEDVLKTLRLNLTYGETGKIDNGVMVQNIVTYYLLLTEAFALYSRHSVRHALKAIMDDRQNRRTVDEYYCALYKDLYGAHLILNFVYVNESIYLGEDSTGMTQQALAVYNNMAMEGHSRKILALANQAAEKTGREKFRPLGIFLYNDLIEEQLTQSGLKAFFLPTVKDVTFRSVRNSKKNRENMRV